MKYKKSILIFICTIIFLLSIASVVASDTNTTTIITNDNDHLGEKSNADVVNSSQNEVVSNENTGTFTELQAKIVLTQHGGEITLDKDYTYDEGFSKLGILIGKDITINGNGHTLNGLSKSRILTVTFDKLLPNKVILNNIKFVNGKTDLYGGAIFNYGDLTVNNCVFTNNYAKNCGGAINSVGYLKCRNSVFNKNTAEGDGGAILSLSFDKSTLYYTNYYKNKTIIGDMEFIFPIMMEINIKFETDHIASCTFTNNVAKGRGGGAIYGFSNLDINKCKFNSNKAGEVGGAIFGNKDLYIKNSKFTSNQAPLYGGAVYFKCHEQSGKYVNDKWVSEIKFYSSTIQSSSFTKNTASDGGAIYGFVTSPSDKIHSIKAVKCTFTNNKAKKHRDIYGTIPTKCVFNYLKLTLKSVNVKKSAKKLVLTAVLKKGNNPIKNKKLVFKFNGKTYIGKTNKKGIAKIVIKKSNLSKLKVNKYVKYQVSYGKLTVKKVAKVKK